MKAKHSFDIFGLEFLDRDRKLITLSLRNQTPIHIYDVQSGDTLLSFDSHWFTLYLMAIKI